MSLGFLRSMVMRWPVFVLMARCRCRMKFRKVAAYSDGLVKVYELLDPLDLSKWQLQAEYQNVLDPIPRLQKRACSSASIAWNPQRELGLPEGNGDPVYALARAPNIGRPYEIVAVATCKVITIWHPELNSNGDGRVSVDKAASLSGHNGEVDWDVSGMTLASVGSDNTVRLCLANLNGVPQEKATLESKYSSLHGAVYLPFEFIEVQFL